MAIAMPRVGNRFDKVDRMKINIHVGVHKTATTYMQKRLEVARPDLMKSGIDYMPRDPFRKAFTSRLKDIEPGDFRIGDLAAQVFEGVPHGPLDRLILSDENLIGNCARILASGEPFDTGKGRLSRVRALFPDADITLYCCIRSYDSFLASAYCETLRFRRKFLSFDAFVEHLRFEALRWPSVLDRLIKGLRPDRTKIWRYEDFREHSDRILQDMAFGTPVPVVAKTQDKPERESFSQMAIDVLDLIDAQKGPDVAGLLINVIGNKLLKSEGFDGFAPWSDEKRKSLGKAYEEDCAALDSALWLVPPKAERPLLAG